ncbi:hypothetical protein ACFW2V_12250 [Streptomyces sp. NPDC058947]|uniref:hypothetical protein n=1 Tax=Streptomyces sp. NPDC058947 TaxID=3346675 RepID=UPI00367A62A1
MKLSKKVAIAAALTAGAVWAVHRARGRADQAWFWTPEWQAGEREADQELKSGKGVVFDNPEDMFAGVRRADL